MQTAFSAFDHFGSRRVHGGHAGHADRLAATAQAAAAASSLRDQSHRLADTVSRSKTAS